MICKQKLYIYICIYIYIYIYIERERERERELKNIFEIVYNYEPTIHILSLQSQCDNNFSSNKKLTPKMAKYFRLDGLFWPFMLVNLKY